MDPRELQFLQAVVHNDVATIESSLQNGVNVEVLSPGRVTPLMLAALRGHVDAVSSLLKAGADPRAEDDQGMTPLLYAVGGQGDDGSAIPIVQILVEAGADINAQASNGYRAMEGAIWDSRPCLAETLGALGADPLLLTPEAGLLWAGLVGDADLAVSVIQAGARPDVGDHSGDTALMWASCGPRHVRSFRPEQVKGFAAVVSVLLAAGANPNVVDGQGKSALLKTDDPKIARLLLQAGADPNACSDAGRTALMCAAELGSAEMLNLLIDAGADVHARQPSGKTVLMWAADGHGHDGYNDAVKVLLEAGAGDIEALVWASMRGLQDLVEALIKAGVDVNITDAGGTTPLMAAVRWLKEDMVTLLIRHKADPLHPDATGQTPLGHASTLHPVRAAEILKRLGREGA